MTNEELLDEDVVAAFPEYSVTTPCLGKGGFKVAYLASKDGVEFVLKILRQGSEDSDGTLILDERFIREIQIMSDLDSPNIVKIIGKVENRKIGNRVKAWYCEPYYGGGSLDEIIATGKLALNDSIILANDLFEALLALESAKIVHRDIKPANICRTTDGRFVLLDLGVARALDMNPLTATGAVAPKSNPYAAPEQFYYSQNASIDSRTDMFASGIVLHESICGDHPFIKNAESITLDEYFARVDSYSPDNLVEYGCSPEIQQVIARCLATRKNRRFRNISQVLNKIRGVK